jgi:CubicO group peptidase (beta-lactamase class C family)
MRSRDLGRRAAAALMWIGLLSCGGAPTETDPYVEPIDPVDYCGGVCWPAATWTQVADAALGWSQSGLDRVRDQYQQIGSDALMVVDRGLLVVRWGNVTRNHIVQSCRKSFLSALYGIYEDEGMIDLSLDMAGLGIDDNVPPSLTDVEKQATLQQLLQARSGVYHEAAAESQSMKDARPGRWSHDPGTFWYYNNWDFNVLGVALMQLTGEDLFEALYDRLAVPLQMQDFEVSNGFYHYEPISEHPAYPFAMSARDMARFGLLFAREGQWGDEQIIAEAWVEESTTGYSDAGGTFDYGYMWWVGKPDFFHGHRMFAALGGAGHAIFVFPEIDLVVVHRVDAATYRHGWDEVTELLDRVIQARTP